MRIRKSARAILINEKGQVLLFKFVFKNVKGDKVLWVTPGGGLKEGENFKAALKRELFEETGIHLNEVGPWTCTRELLINGKNGDFISYERYFLIHTDSSEIQLLNMTDNEKDTLKDIKWWDVDEILKANEEFGPPEIGELVHQINIGNVPKEPLKLN